MISRDDATKLLHEHVQSDSLRKHCLAVAYACEAYADYFQADRDLWFATGLLHDFDYEEFPTKEHHPFEGVKILKDKGYPAEIIEAILGHAEYSGVKRASNLAKTLFAVDELSGFIVALAKVRPGNFEGMSSDSVKKALKKKGFAEAISREDITKGIQELNIPDNQHFERVINALRDHAQALGFSSPKAL
ncbi:MAG: HD domain-containing protein [Nanoarchaeota archaeon]